MHFDRPLGLPGRLLTSILILFAGVLPAYLGGALLWDMVSGQKTAGMGAVIAVAVCFLVVYLIARLAWRVTINKPLRRDGGLFPPMVILPVAYFFTIGGAVSLVKCLHEGDVARAIHAAELMAIGSGGVLIVKRRKPRPEAPYKLPAAQTLDD